MLVDSTHTVLFILLKGQCEWVIMKWRANKIKLFRSRLITSYSLTKKDLPHIVLLFFTVSKSWKYYFTDPGTNNITWQDLTGTSILVLSVTQRKSRKKEKIISRNERRVSCYFPSKSKVFVFFVSVKQSFRPCTIHYKYEQQ